MDEWSFDRLWKAEHFGRGNSASKGTRWEGAQRVREMSGAVTGCAVELHLPIAKPWGSHLPDPNPPKSPQYQPNWLSCATKSDPTQLLSLFYFLKSIFHFSQQTIFYAP